MPSSATVCFVLAAVYCIANILVIRKSTRWSNQMWAGGSSKRPHKNHVQIILGDVGLLVRLLLCCFRHSTARVAQECAKYLFKTPQCILTFTHSLHFVQQCLAPQQYVSCWLRCIALQTFLSSEKAPVGQISCGPSGSSNGRTRIMFKSFWDASVCRSSGCGCCCVVSGILTVFKSLKRCAKYLHIKTPQCILTVFTHLYTLFSNA